MIYQTLATTPRTIRLQGVHNVGAPKPLKVRSQLNRSLETAAIAQVMSQRGTSIAVARTIPSVWSMARQIRDTFAPFSPIPDEIRLVQNFRKTEISPSFELIEMLARGVGAHHAGLSDEVRALIEWLAEEGKLRVLCATTTIAQGINFPVSSVFLASRFFFQDPISKEMPPRDFWNLAGRAGRMNHDSVGVVGLAAGESSQEIVEYVSRALGELVSRLVNMLNNLEQIGCLNNLESVIQGEEWEDFRCYVAHLWNEKKNLDAVLADTEQLLRNTYGYGVLRASDDGKVKADKLLEATRNYARRLADKPGHAALADMTGFSPEGVEKALAGLGQLERKLTPADWTPESLFGQSSSMADLFGVMFRVPQLAEALKDLGGTGTGNQHIAEITQAWVSGKSLQDIAIAYFQGDVNDTKAITSAITNACRAIYRNLVNNGTWGLSALSRLSGIDFDSLSESERRRINAIPAMIYHGVHSEEAVLMRMNSAPRSVAEKLGEEFRSSTGINADKASAQEARQFLKNLDVSGWGQVRPEGAYLSGAEYKSIWELLSGEQSGSVL